MTDTGPGDRVDDIDVFGQRRIGRTAPFPERPQPVVPNGEHDELPPDLDPEPDPCANPATRSAWNADAAAAAAARAMVAAASALNDGSSFANREFGTILYRGPNGGIANTGITWGLPGTPNEVPRVTLNDAGVTRANWMGDIHNHPSGDGRLSDDEWHAFVAYVNEISVSNPERRFELAGLAAYVVVADASAPDGYRIYAHTRDTPYGELGQEVNPDAQPCPN